MLKPAGVSKLGEDGRTGTAPCPDPKERVSIWTKCSPAPVPHFSVRRHLLHHGQRSRACLLLLPVGARPGGRGVLAEESGPAAGTDPETSPPWHPEPGRSAKHHRMN